MRRAAGASFDPRRIGKAVQRAGFTLRRIRADVRGTLSRAGDALVLEMPGRLAKVVLVGGRTLEDPRGADAIGQRIRVEGTLRILDASRPPELSVDSWSFLE